MRWRRRFEVVALGTSGSAISQRSVISEHRSERDAREAAGLERRRLEVIRAEEAASWSILVVRDGEILHEERPFDGHGEDAPVPPLTALHIRQSETPPAAQPPAIDDDADPTPTGSLPAIPDTADIPAPPDTDDTAEGGHAPDDEPADAVASPAAPGFHPADADEAAPTGGGAPAAVPEFDTAPEFDAAPDDAGGATGRVARPAAVDPVSGSGSESEPEPARDADVPPSGRVPDEIIRRFEESIERERARDARR